MLDRIRQFVWRFTGTPPSRIMADPIGQRISFEENEAQRIARLMNVLRQSFGSSEEFLEAARRFADAVKPLEKLGDVPPNDNQSK